MRVTSPNPSPEASAVGAGGSAVAVDTVEGMAQRFRLS
jgi:hypothetical protein